VYPRWLLLTVRSFFVVLSFVSPRVAGRIGLRLFCTPRRHHVPEWEREITAAGKRLRVGPHLVAYTFGTGPVVLLVHGWEGRSLQMGRFIEPFVQAGFRVIAIDLPAHGASPGTRTDLIECTEALRKVGRDLGPVAAVVTHSFGGAITTLALERGFDARSVVLIAAPSSIDDVVRRFGELMGLGGAAMRAFRVGIERQTGVKLVDVEIFERVAGLQVPALIVHDRGDAEVPFHDAERLVARWPNATLLATEGLGHRRILKDDEVIGRAVDFVRSATASVVATSDGMTSLQSRITNHESRI
jgi:pimeloyl-ACP methyl ester carboxylesterase